MINAAPQRRAIQETQPIQRLAKADIVYEYLRDAILKGKIEPGALIDKSKLCEQLKVSRFPVTTAINRLAFERLVIIEPQHGSFVSRISVHDAREFLRIRRALETDIAAQAAVGLPEEPRGALRRNIRYQQAASEAEDTVGFYALDFEFHHIIVAGLQLNQSNEILKGLRAHAERVRHILAPHKSRLPAIFKEHHAIWERIDAHDSEGARKAMHAHIDQTINTFEGVVRERPDLFV